MNFQVVQSSMCFTKSSLYVPIQQLRDANPLLAACVLALYADRKQLVDGFNKLEDIGESFQLSITKNYIEEEEFTINMEDIRKQMCEYNTFNIILICIFILFLIIVIAVLFCQANFKKKPKKDVNPLNADVVYITEDTEVKEVEEYYDDDQPGDTAKVTDQNMYYKSDMCF